MTALCKVDALPDGSAKGFEIGDQKLVLIHYRGTFYLYRNSCPHRSIPLEWTPDQFLDYDRNFIQCATHGALFRIEDGLCISGPCVDDHLDAIAVRVEAGWVVADL